ncbi:hypothetical protein HPG84_14735 [Salmonella enterica]|nr:hypothetical protein HPG84_14735 [Salmonella enterica]
MWLQQRQTGVDSAAKRHFQRGTVAFNQGFSEGFVVISEYGEIRGGAEGNSK